MALMGPVVSSMSIEVDRSCSGGASHNRSGSAADGGSLQGGEVDLPLGGMVQPPDLLPENADGGTYIAPSWGQDPWGAVNIGATSGRRQSLQNFLNLAVWVDHSVIEVFAMGGHGRVTSRIYPLTSASAWGVSAWARCSLVDLSVMAEVYQVDSAWI